MMGTKERAFAPLPPVSLDALVPPGTSITTWPHARTRLKQEPSPEELRPDALRVTAIDPDPPSQIC
jgi:hypothetical protein